MNDAITAIFKHAPDQTALVFKHRRVTYRQLTAESLRLAAELKTAFADGDRLALWLPNSPDVICLYLACFHAGLTPMPLYAGMTQCERQAVFDQSRPQGMITHSALPGDVQPVDAGRLFRISNENGSLRLYRAGAPAKTGIRAAACKTRATSSGLVVHTSGSCGRPKGVFMSRPCIDAHLRQRIDGAGLSPASRLLNASCLAQSVGFFQALALLAAGGTMVLLESYRTDAMVEALHRHRPTHLIMVVGAFDRLLHHPAITPASLESVQFAAAGADRITTRVQQRFHALTGRTLGVTYGLTELSWAMANFSSRPDKALSLGKPLDDVDARLVDGLGQDVPTGSVGEIILKSRRMMSGYLLDPARTRRVLTRRWLKTGDLASRDRDGFYWFVDRRKNLIVLNSGDNVSPIEVEQAILAHPAVSHCAVVGVEIPDCGHVPVAAVVRNNPKLTETALQTFLRERLSDFKIPPHIRFMSALPVGNSGKIQKQAIRERFQAADRDHPDRDQPGTQPISSAASSLILSEGWDGRQAAAIRNMAPSPP